MANRGAPVGQLVFLVGVLVAHDAVLLPLAIGVGALIGRLVPASAQVAVRMAAFVSVVVALIATPFVLGYGRTADEPVGAAARLQSRPGRHARCSVGIRRHRRPDLARAPSPAAAPPRGG